MKRKPPSFTVTHAKIEPGRRERKAPPSSAKRGDRRVSGPLATEVAKALYGSPLSFPDKLR
jgi:hypothetical protein